MLSTCPPLRYLSRMRNGLTCFFALAAAIVAGQQPLPKETRILFVYDASRSMSGKHESTTRMESAKQLFFRFIDSLARNPSMQFALRMYGHTVKYPPGDCRDSKLIVPFGKGNVAQIKQKVSEAKPTGITPIEHSLTQSANDFKDNKGLNIVILITDGIEECGGDPCKARKKLIEKGIVFRPFIIGIGLTPEQIRTFECVGEFFSHDQPEVIGTIASIIQQQQLNKTTVQVNLLDQASLPKESDVNMTFYDVTRREYKYNYIHTMNVKGNPDTLVIDDYPSYKVIAHTIPPAQSEVTRLTPGKHHVIPIDAPQGYLQLKRNEGAYNFSEKVKCIVRKHGDMQTLNVQQMNSREKYLIGDYDLEILTLPRTYVSSNNIAQGATAVVEVPNAGMAQLRCPETGDGCILAERGNRLEWVCNLTSQSQQTFYLQPGNYVATWRARSLKSSIYTIEKKFVVRSDLQTVVEMYR
jgi:Ca-activated chloride channel homolog